MRFVNISPVMTGDPGLENSVMNIAVSITALFSAVVVIGRLSIRTMADADRTMDIREGAPGAVLLNDEDETPRGRDRADRTCPCNTTRR